MQIALDRGNPMPLYTQVAQDIQRRIRSGALPPGARLPTIRALALQLGVTRLTVHAAYNELQSGGWIEATVGRGTFVAEGIRPHMSAAELGREVSAGGLISDMLRMAQLPGIRSLAMADAAPDLYPQRDFGRAVEEALAVGPAMFGYTTPHGDPILRSILADLLVDRGMHVTSDELVITSGVTQGLAMVAQALAQPGDTAIVEQPTYLGALSVFGSRGLRLIGASMDEHGLVTDELENLILAHRPRFIYAIPAFQNPTGVCMSAERRTHLLAIAARHRVPIIEDDIYARVIYEGSAPPALYAEDRSGMVLHLSSFSKVLLPGVRLGYIAAAPQWVGRLIHAKQTSDLCSPPLLQRAMAIFIQRGGLANHLRRALPRYRERRDVLLSAMSRYFPSDLRWTEPRGGFNVWVTLPPFINTTDLYLAGIERGVAFVPGNAFFTGPTAQPYMRLAFSGATPEVIIEAVRVLGELLGTHAMRRTLVRETPNDYVPLV
ncbi:MAG: PLP-dependent aminotransferase family protein [Roseiflexaceae bacterium]|nr:PLP-dependent aminotransferase family protein [Roseiflexaceae bacterium]